MYKLYLPNNTVQILYSLPEWHKKLIQLQAQGINYHTHKQTNFGWAFYF